MEEENEKNIFIFLSALILLSHSSFSEAVEINIGKFLPMPKFHVNYYYPFGSNPPSPNSNYVSTYLSALNKASQGVVTLLAVIKPLNCNYSQVHFFMYSGPQPGWVDDGVETTITSATCQNDPRKSLTLQQPGTTLPPADCLESTQGCIQIITDTGDPSKPGQRYYGVLDLDMFIGFVP